MTDPLKFVMQVQQQQCFLILLDHAQVNMIQAVSTKCPGFSWDRGGLVWFCFVFPSQCLNTMFSLWGQPSRIYKGHIRVTRETSLSRCSSHIFFFIFIFYKLEDQKLSKGQISKGLNIPTPYQRATNIPSMPPLDLAETRSLKEKKCQFQDKELYEEVWKCFIQDSGQTANTDKFNSKIINK